MNRLVFATHNANKVKEVRELLSSSFEILSLDDKDWSPLTFGLDMLSDNQTSNNDLSFQATNLLEISESYFDETETEDHIRTHNKIHKHK